MKVVLLRGLLVLLALILSSLCFLYGVFHAVPGTVYTGLRSSNVSDLHTHMSWIDQARHGRFFMKNEFTAEPHAGVMVRPGYFLLSIPFAFSSLSNAAVYHIERIFTGVLLLVGLFFFLRVFLATEREVHIGFLLIVFTSGAGFLLQRWLHDPVDLSVPESWLFASLGEGPHFLLSLALLWLGIVSFYQWAGGAKGKMPIILGSLVFLWWEHPFDAVILIGACCANLWILPSNRQRILFLAAVGILSLPAFLYYEYLKTQPAFSGWGSAQNLMLTPPFLSVLAGFAFLICLAVPGAMFLSRQPEKRKLLLFLLCWIGAQLVMVYLPFPFQRRLLAGIQFPLAILAAYGASRIRWNTVVAVILVVASTGSFFLMRQEIRDLNSNGMPYYLPLSYKQAFDWLQQQPVNGPILSEFVTGNFIPAYTGFQTYVGHSSLTPDVAAKRKMMEQFYRQPDPAFLKKNGFQYIFWGAEEYHTAPGGKLQALYPVAYGKDGVFILKAP